jgi:hypothetical protein
MMRGFFDRVQPNRKLTRATWVSTAIAGLSNAWFKITLAVFLPTPARDTKSSMVSGTFPLNFSIKLLEVAIIAFVLLL